MRQAPMQFLRNLCLPLLLAASLGAQAAVIEGQQFDDRIRLADTELVLNGVGLRAVAWFKGYAAGLYVVEKASSAEAVLAQKGPKRLRMRMMVEVESKEFVKAFNKGMRRNLGEAERDALRDRIERFDRTVAELVIRLPARARPGAQRERPEEGRALRRRGVLCRDPEDLYRQRSGRQKAEGGTARSGLRATPPLHFPSQPSKEKPPMHRRTFIAAAAMSLMAASPLVMAQAYPSKPVRLVVPFAPGGAMDIVARIISEKMGAALGQTVVVENKAGAGGVIGAVEVVKAAPDGYTLSMATVSTTAANPAINPKIPYDPVADFVPIMNIAATPNLIAVHPSFPAKDYKSFMQQLKSNPGKYSYASSGTGGIGHLQTELFKSLSGTFITHIPYRGAGPALNDTVAGQVPIIFDNLPSALPFVKEGRLVPIVVAAPQRLAVLPDVPTFKEMGLEPVNRMAYYGLLAPKGTPKEIIDKLHAAAKTALQDPGVRQRIEATGSLIVGNSPAEFAEQIKAELAVYRKVVAQQKLSL